jgi:predicted HTH transcriptional regulator
MKDYDNPYGGIKTQEAPTTDGLPLFDICRSRHQGNQFSEAANESISREKSKLCEQVYELIAQSHGLTCEDVEATLSLSHQTASARISELKKAGRVGVSGTRKTKSGRNAGVYRVI